MQHDRQLNPDKVKRQLHEYQTCSDTTWQQIGQQMALQLFQAMAERVPAYKDFLRHHRVNPALIKSYADWQQIPPMDKPSYIDKYPLHQLCWGGELGNAYMLSASSGSTGEPYFWPRSAEQTEQGAMISAPVYQALFQAHEQSTLYIVTFGMGVWIAGTYMMMATQAVAQWGFPITVVTPGVNKPEILKLIKFGQQYYAQIILVGLPPFIKDVIDTGIAEGIDWQAINLKFMFTGEAFTERWRDHLQAKVGMNPLTDAMNIYGSADVGLIAHETATTVFLRRLAAQQPAIAQLLFQADRVPSVNQYNPHLRHFEQLDGELLISARSGIPLLRYNTKDVGDVLYFGDAVQRLQSNGIDLTAEFQKQLDPALLWRLPMVYLFGRGKFSATLYGILIYPEYIKYVLDHSTLTPLLTGRFVLQTEETADFGQQLHLRVELSEGATNVGLVAAQVQQLFIAELPKISSEYKHLLETVHERAHPKVTVYPYGDPDYFPRGIVRKTA
jgi:phenylacetate-CoA ligase